MGCCVLGSPLGHVTLSTRAEIRVWKIRVWKLVSRCCRAPHPPRDHWGCPMCQYTGLRCSAGGFEPARAEHIGFQVQPLGPLGHDVHKAFAKKNVQASESATTMNQTPNLPQRAQQRQHDPATANETSKTVPTKTLDWAVPDKKLQNAPTHDGIRTHNLCLRRATRYPLRYASLKGVRVIQEFYS